jgi:hypothetical protein
MIRLSSNCRVELPISTPLHPEGHNNRERRKVAPTQAKIRSILAIS